MRAGILCPAILSLCAVAVCAAQDYRIETFAGNGTAGFAGDGGPVSRSVLNSPSSVTFDSLGRLYIGDRGNERVRRVEPDFTIRTVVEGIPVSDLAFDSAGVLYIAGGSAVTAISTTGEASVFAGPDATLSQPVALAVESAGVLLVADGNRVLRVTAGAATELASFGSAVTGIARTPDGTVYAASGGELFRVPKAGSPVSTGIRVPDGARLAADNWGDVYFSGSSLAKVSDGRAWTLAGTGTPGFGGDSGSAAMAQLNGPAGISVDAAGNVWFADTLNQRIRVLRPRNPGAVSAITPGHGVAGIWPRVVELRWTPIPGATTYEVFAGRSPAELTRAGSSTEGFFRLENLPANAPHYWQVRTSLQPLPPVVSPVFFFRTTELFTSAPTRPERPYPPNGSMGQPLQVTLSWRGTGAARYEVHFSEEGAAAVPIALVAESTLNLQGLRPETAYNWRIVSVNEAGRTSSDVWRFVTGPVAGYPWILQTLAGTTLPVADGTPLTEAVLILPSRPVMDAAGNIVFISGNGTVRRAGIDGRLSTVFVPGAGMAARAVAADASQNIYIAMPDHVVRISQSGQRTIYAGQPGRRGYGGDDASATRALFDGIADVAADRAGALYIADAANHRVRLVAPGGYVRTVAGTGACGEGELSGAAANVPLCSPSRLTLDDRGNLYVAASGRIFRVSPDENVTVIAGKGAAGYEGDGGAAAEAAIGPVAGLAADRSGNVYVLDGTAQTIRRVDAEGVITTWAGVRGRSGFGGDGLRLTELRLTAADGLSFDRAGNLLIGDTHNHRIRRIDDSGFVSTAAGADPLRGERGPATWAYLNRPTDVAATATGIYVADSGNHRIRRIIGGSIETVAGGGGESLTGPELIGRDGRDLRLELTCNGFVDIDWRGDARFNSACPGGLGSGVHSLLGLTPGGLLNSFATLPQQRVGGLATGLVGEVYLSDPVAHRIYRVMPDGSSQVFAGNGAQGFAGEGGPALTAQMNFPGALALGPDGELYVAEVGRIRRITLDGRIVTVAAVSAQGLAFDPNRVLHVTSGSSVYATLPDPQAPGQWTLTRIAGREGTGAPGANTLALSTRLGTPAGLTFTADGDLVFADSSENRIFRLFRNVPAAITLVSGDNQTADEKGSLSQPVVMKVSGRTGIPVAGATVRLLLESFGRLTEVARGVSDANGDVRLFFSPGQRTGTLTLHATVTGIPSVPVRVNTGR